MNTTDISYSGANPSTLIGLPVERVDTPSLVVDLDLLASNISNMAQTTARYEISLRPHIKTHKTISIGRMQLAAGAAGITTAKLSEAKVFADAGFDDILLAYPVVGEHKIQSLLALSERITLRSCVDNVESALAISRAASASGVHVDLLLDINTGLGRTGCSPSKAVQIGRQIAELPGLNLVGVFSFAGYQPADPDPLVRQSWAYNEARTCVAIATSLRTEGIPANVVSVAGTSCTPFAVKVKGVTEVRPGTYVFGDMNYVRLGVHSIETCALRIRTTVISRPTRRQLVLDAGTKVLAADHSVASNTLSYGYLPEHPNSLITRVWEEHSVVDLDSSDYLLRIGDIVEVIPNHVCAVMNLARHWYGVRDGLVLEVHGVDARGLVT